MSTLLERLLARESDIRLAVVGIGSIGSVWFHQAHITPGMRPAAIADTSRARAEEMAQRVGLEYEIVDGVAELEDAIGRGVLAVTDDSQLLASTERIDAFLEATNAMVGAARHCETALEHGQHVVMMNFEADLMFGPYLAERARNLDLVYTAADGDQPTAIKRIVDDIRLWGFEVAVAGNVKGFHDLYTNPTIIAPEADKRGLDHKMCSSYADGSKLCVEMAVVANALGMSTAVPGMHGPRLGHVMELFDHLDVETLWRENGPTVDYVLGAEPKGGVFVVGYTESEIHQHTLAWYPPDMGPGPFYMFYRPYHLGGIEAMNCVAEAVLDGSARLRPDHGMRTNVFAYAKKDLRAGDVVDGIGGYAAYGLIENLADNADRPGLPICLADDLRLRRDIGRDERIRLEDVEYDPESPGFALYRRAVEAAPAPRI